MKMIVTVVLEGVPPQGTVAQKVQRELVVERTTQGLDELYNFRDSVIGLAAHDVPTLLKEIVNVFQDLRDPPPQLPAAPEPDSPAATPAQPS
jgi:hypothetical protein